MKCNFDFCLLVFFFNTVPQSVSWQKWWTDKLVCRNCWLKGMMLLDFWRADWTHLTWQIKVCQENPGIKHPRIQHASMVSVHGKWEHKILERIFSLKFKWMHVKLICPKLRNDIIWIIYSKLPPVKSEKELQERLRILQNQNRFLNEEVKKLAKLRQADKSTFYQQEE